MNLLRRAYRRLSRLFSDGTEVVYCKRYCLDLPGVPVDRFRSENILTFLASEGLLRPRELHVPESASFSELARVHDEDYLTALAAPGAMLRVMGVELDAAQEDRALDSQRLMAGGSILAARLALDRGRPTINLGGGLHHAHSARGAGFCAVNDIAVAIADVRSRGLEGPIVVVDLDLHDGDGTRTLFAHDPSVHTFSIHNQTWDESPAQEATTVALGSGIDDATYLEALERTLPPVLERIGPEMVFYVAGCDPAQDDVLGDWNLTRDGLFARDRFVVETLADATPGAPMVVLLAGGYGTSAWRYTADFLGWLIAGKRLRVPSTDAVTLRRLRFRRDSFLPASELTATDDPDDWGLSEEDLFPGAPPKRARFLDYYSLQGVEIALERLGLTARLAELGYPKPHLVFELDNPLGQTVRIFADASQRELLSELRVRRDRRVASGFEMLFVEWLLLQNPRAKFPQNRKPLPGQGHPGLGMLREVLSVLVLACERLELDGVAFVPSHYHLAAQSSRYLRFLDPAAQGRFELMREALGELRLSAAARAVADERLIDASDGPVVWQPAPMALPVSERLKGRLAGEEYAAEVAEARTVQGSFRLLESPPESAQSRESQPARLAPRNTRS